MLYSAVMVQKRSFRAGRTGGFRQASGLLKDRIRDAGAKRGFAVTRLLTHWTEIVGPETAKIARPVDVRYGREGFGATLTILTTGSAAPMLQMQEPKLRAKINAVYGYNAIARIRLTQTAPTGFAEGQAQFEPAEPAKPAPTTSIENQRQANDLTGAVEDDGLRSALNLLAQNVLSKSNQTQKEEQ
ncbi:MAG: DciA family protein [Pseudomonadota bacterium]